MQNNYIERFNRLCREAVLDAYHFVELQGAQIPPMNGKYTRQKKSQESLQNLTPEERKKKRIKNFETLHKAV